MKRSKRFWTYLILSSVLIGMAGPFAFKAVEFMIVSAKYKTIATNICKIMEPDIQRGRSREALEYSFAVLRNFDIEPMPQVFIAEDGKVLTTQINKTLTHQERCDIAHRDSIDVKILFPPLTIFDYAFFYAYLASVALVSFAVTLAKAVHDFFSERKKRLALAEVAMKLAHDLRAPLRVMVKVINESKHPSEETRQLALGAGCRIGEMADDLLTKHRSFSAGKLPSLPEKPDVIHGASVTEKLTPGKMRNQIKQVIEEKRTLVSDLDIKVILNDTGITEKAMIQVKPLEFQRALSNLIENAIEAIQRKSANSGRVEVILESTEKTFEVAVKDNGMGIPEDILPTIFDYGRTYGKEKGNGLGLFHAKDIVESFGGKITVTTMLGQGSVFKISLPKVGEFDSVVQPLDLVLIDDQQINHVLWQVEAKKRSKKLACYFSVDEFIKNASGIPKDTPVFVDSYLGNGFLGEEQSKEIYEIGFRQIFLTTSDAVIDLKNYPWLTRVVGKDFPAV